MVSRIKSIVRTRYAFYSFNHFNIYNWTLTLQTFHTNNLHCTLFVEYLQEDGRKNRII